MPVIFARNTGRVTMIQDSVATGSVSLVNISDDRQNVSYVSHNTIFTRLGLSTAANVQFAHSIGNDIYIYVFGDRMGQIVLHSLSFADNSGNNTVKENPSMHGFEQFFNWYRQNRVVMRRTPVIVTIGLATAFRGFITSLNADVQDPLHRTIQSQMTLSLLPD